jgi:TonB family protein
MCRRTLGIRKGNRFEATVYRRFDNGTRDESDWHLPAPRDGDGEERLCLALGNAFTSHGGRDNSGACYRVDATEGKVFVKMIIDEVGRISEVQVVQSSGYAVLDQNTVDILRHIRPVSLPHPLGQPFIRLQFPMTYRLNRHSHGSNWCTRVNG